MTSFSNYALIDLKEQIKQTLAELFEEDYPSIEITIPVKVSPRREFGELSSPVCFSLAKKLGKEDIRKNAHHLAKKVVEQLESTDFSLVAKIEAVNGYLNFFLDWDSFSKTVLRQVQNMEQAYGETTRGRNKKVVVEHTSANPVHPLHIGTARNSVLGDSIARMLEAANYTVQRRYYLDDVGKQVAYLSYGYGLVENQLEKQGKVDHFFGILYSCVTSLIRVKKLETSLKSAKKDYYNLLKSLKEKLSQTPQDIRESDVNRELESLASLHLKKMEQYPTADWKEDAKRLYEEINTVISEIESKEHSLEPLSSLLKRAFRKGEHERRGLEDILDLIEVVEEAKAITSEISMKWPETYETLAKKITDENVAENAVDKIVHDYERGTGEFKELIHSICQQTFNGFKETLRRIDISFDKIDWESKFVWEGVVDEIIDRLKERNWTVRGENNAVKLDIHKAVQEVPAVRDFFDLKKEKVEKLVDEGKWRELPPNFVLLRGDGSSLYATRDIAYSLQKFNQDPEPNQVINVIGKDQTLAQKQVAAGLYLAGFEKYAKTMTHYSYELVKLPHYSMSARQGRYRTLDEIIEEAKVRAYREVKKRETASWHEAEEIAEKIAIGAIRFFLLSTDPGKVLTFKWEEIMNFKRNSGPFIQYSYARATSILEKAESSFREEVPNISYSETLSDEREQRLLFKLARYPEVVHEAVEKLLPNLISDYCNELANFFHTFYEHCPVLRASQKERKIARLHLVKAYVQVLDNALSLLGIPSLETM